MTQTLLEPFKLHGKMILAVKGYDSDKSIGWSQEPGGKSVLASRVTSGPEILIGTPIKSGI